MLSGWLRKLGSARLVALTVLGLLVGSAMLAEPAEARFGRSSGRSGGFSSFGSRGSRSGGTGGGLFQPSRPSNNGGGVFGGILLDKIEVNAVPEPATMGLMGLAATGLFVVRRRRLSV